MRLTKEQQGLLKACRQNDVVKAGKLLKNGISPRTCDKDGLSCLNTACLEEAAETIRLLLNADAELVNLPDENKQYPIECIVETGNVALFDELIGRGADYRLDKEGFSLLHLAAYYGQTAIIDRLLSLGLDIDAQDQNGEGRTALIWAAETGNADTLRHLLEKGADPHLSDEEGFTALDTAVGEGHTELVRLLLDAGVDVNQRTHNNGTVLHTAIAWEREDIVELLLEKGAQTDIRNDHGETPLDLR